MKLSTKGRYAARAMLELALNEGKGPIQLKEIARKQDISERYLERLMSALVSAGLVRSVRGQNGGFSLAKPIHEIRLSRIIQATEGSMSLVECVEDPKLCNRCELCVTHEIWTQMRDAVFEVLDSITLKKMVAMHSQKCASKNNQMYHI